MVLAAMMAMCVGFLLACWPCRVQGGEPAVDADHVSREVTETGWAAPWPTDVHNAVGFVHLRKAGGTNWLAMLKAWMVGTGCIPLNAVPFVGSYGIQQGRLNERCKSHCPDFNLAHIEWGCVDGEALLRVLPDHSNSMSSKRLGDRYALAAVIRDPIERVGSQAFYGIGNFGPKLIRDSIRAACSTPERLVSSVAQAKTDCKHNMIPQNMCGCARETYDTMIRNISTNSALWFNYFKKEMYGDGYMSNYYIKRLNNHIEPNPERISAFNASVECIKMDAAAAAGDVKEGSCGKSGLDTMKDLFLQKCTMNWSPAPDQTATPTAAPTQELKSTRRKHRERERVVMDTRRPRFDATRSLEVAKQLLDKHFRVFVLELDHSNPHHFIDALADVLRVPREAVAGPILHEHAKTNAGVLHSEDATRTEHAVYSYRTVMPADVQAFLERENAEDMALFEYVKARQEKELVQYYANNPQYITHTTFIKSKTLSGESASG